MPMRTCSNVATKIRIIEKLSSVRVMRKLANGINQAKRFLRSLSEDIDFFGFSGIEWKKEVNILMVSQAERIDQTEKVFLFCLG